MKAPQNLPGAFGRKIALDIGDAENQYGQQDKNFDGVIQEKLQAAAQYTVWIQAEGGQALANPSIEPLHSQNLILKDQPDGAKSFHTLYPFHWTNSFKIFDLIIRRKAIGRTMAFYFWHAQSDGEQTVLRVSSASSSFAF